MNRSIVICCWLLMTVMTLLPGAGFPTSASAAEIDQLSTGDAPEPDAAIQPVGENVPQIEFDELVHDFGDVIGGTKLMHIFKFRNTGKTDLLVEQVKGG